MTDYTMRSTERTVSKRCGKCGQAGYYRKGTRRCRMRKFGVGSYCCWGDLMPLRQPRKKAAVSHGDRFRERALNRLTVARLTLRTWERRQRRAEKLAHKWTLRVAQWERKAQFTDEQVEQLRERASHAARIRKVGRRLLKAAGEEQTA